MNISMPFEPLDAYESLQLLLPPFSLKLSKSDLNGFIIDGFVSRRFIVRGRFKDFGHTRAMRSPEDMTVKSFLSDTIPRVSANPLYKGDAIGFVVEGARELYTERDERRLTDFPDNTSLSFVYERPTIWQPFVILQDQVYKVQYRDEFQQRHDETSMAEVEKEISIFQLFNVGASTISTLIEAFEHAVDQRSRFGHSAASLRAMKGLALIYRILKRFEEAKEVLGRALSLSYSISTTDSEITHQLLYDFGALYLDQGNTNSAVQQFSLIEKSFRDSDGPNHHVLYTKAVEGLATVAFQNGLLQRAESLLQSLLGQKFGITELPPEYLAIRNKLCMVYWAQGQLQRAHMFCEKTLRQQERVLEPLHYHYLRTRHILAGILSEQCSMSESQMVYTQVLTGLQALIGSDHLDVLKTTELLASQCYGQSKFGEALEFWQNLLESYERILGLEHPTTMEVQYQLAQTLERLGRSNKSIGYLEPLCQMCENLYGNTHPITRRTKILLSNAHHHLGNSLYLESIRRELQSSSPASDGNDSYPTSTSCGSVNMEQRLNMSLQMTVDDTCNWIFEDRSYQAWISSPSPSLLWVRGHAGTGKTVLASAIIDRLRKKKLPTIFFFFDRKDSMLSDPKFLLDSLTSQILQANPGLEHTGNFLPKQALSPTSRSFTRFSELALGFNELFCCIDALDECTSSDMLLQLISTMVRSEAFPIKFLLSSRPNSDILHYMEDLAGVIEIPNEGTERDLSAVIDFYLRDLRPIKKIAHEDIADHLTSRANGMFLWVDFVIKNLEDTGEFLDAPLSLLDKTYHDALLSLTSKLTLSETELLCTTLYWVTTACRPLKVTELQTALALESADTHFEDLKVLSSPRQSIQRIGGPLTRVLSDDTVLPVHQSLVSFLQSESCPSIKISPQISLPFKAEHSNAYISVVCVTYLSFDCFRDPYNSQSQQRYMLLEYAATYWYLHTIRAGEDRSILNLILSFLHSDQCFNWLDALTTFFGKSVEDILLIQSQISTWICQFDNAHVSENSNFVISLYRKKIARLGNHDLMRHSDTVILQKLADIYQAYGLFEEAEILYQRVLGIPAESDSKFRLLQIQNRLAEMGDNDSNSHLIELSKKPNITARTVDQTDINLMRNIALNYQNQGRWDWAEQIQVDVVDLAQKTLGKEHPVTLASISNLGLTYQIQGYWQKAEELFSELMKTHSRLLGQEHPVTLNNMYNLAITYFDQGRWDEAELLQIKVLETRMKNIGQEHPSTLASIHELAKLYQNQGKWSKAEELFEQMIKKRKKVLGPEHPDTLTSINNLASIYQDQGRLKEAEELLVQVTTTRAKILGAEHPHTLTSMNNLALTLQNQGRWKEAEELSLQVTTMNAKVLGAEHPDTLKSMTNLASTYSNQGRWKEAEELEMQVMEMSKRVLGHEHPDTLLSMANLACTLESQDCNAEALELMKECLNLRERILGTEHPDTLKSMTNLASTYSNQKRWKEAEELERQVMETSKRVLGQENPLTLISMANLAFVLKSQDCNADQALELMKECLDLRERVLGSDHPDTIHSFKALNEWRREMENSVLSS